MELPSAHRGEGATGGRLSVIFTAVCLWGCLVVAILAISARPAAALPEFSADTGKDCTYCHVTPGGPVNSNGEAFRDNAFRLPSSTTSNSGTTSPTAGEPPGDGQPATVGPVLSYGRWLRALFLWGHILAVIVWLGAITTVFLVQRLQIAAAGIPRGYLRLALPALSIVGITGVLLTLGSISGAGTLWEARWGALLLTKIAIYVVLVVIAATATLVINPRLKGLVDVKRRPGRSQEQFKAQGRVTVLYRGRVYDITGSRLWPEGRHARQHDAWQDLTASLADAPHGADVLERFTVIEDADQDRTPLPMRLYLGLSLVSIVLILAVVLVVAAW